MAPTIQDFIMVSRPERGDGLESDPRFSGSDYFLNMFARFQYKDWRPLCAMSRATPPSGPSLNTATAISPASQAVLNEPNHHYTPQTPSYSAMSMVYFLSSSAAVLSFADIPSQRLD